MTRHLYTFLALLLLGVSSNAVASEEIFSQDTREWYERFDFDIDLLEEHQLLLADELNKSEGNDLLLFAVATGGNDEIEEEDEEYSKHIFAQKLPPYFTKLTEAFPEKRGKIILIDPAHSDDWDSDEFRVFRDAGFTKSADLPMRAFKENIELVVFRTIISNRVDEGCKEFREAFFESFLTLCQNQTTSGNLLFIGEHGSAISISDLFTQAQKLTSSDNLQTYLCCHCIPPFSVVKTFHRSPVGTWDSRLEQHYTFLLDPRVTYYDLDEDGNEYWGFTDEFLSMSYSEQANLIARIASEHEMNIELSGSLLDLDFTIYEDAEGLHNLGPSSLIYSLPSNEDTPAHCIGF